MASYGPRSHDPVVFADKFLLELYPLVAWCLHEAWPPKNLIQFHYTQFSDLTKLPGKRGLARSSKTDDHYALHTHQF
jgi:hypothetical protein